MTECILGKGYPKLCNHSGAVSTGGPENKREFIPNYPLASLLVESLTGAWWFHKRVGFSRPQRCNARRAVKIVGAPYTGRFGLAIRRVTTVQMGSFCVIAGLAVVARLGGAIRVTSQ